LDDDSSQLSKAAAPEWRRRRVFWRAAGGGRGAADATSLSPNSRAFDDDAPSAIRSNFTTS